jgi:hypothetical protein
MDRARPRSDAGGVPLRLEIEEGHGRYVLVDDGPTDAWTYQFVAAPDGEA